MGGGRGGVGDVWGVEAAVNRLGRLLELLKLRGRRIKASRNRGCHSWATEMPTDAGMVL